MNSKPVALVTGGRRGIGLGIARRLADTGHDIALNGVSAEAPEAVADLEARGARVAYIPADVGRADDRAALVDAVKAAFGRLDLLVNNAGVAPTVRDDILEAGEDSFDRLMAINLRGPYFLTQAVANWMLEQKAADAERAPAIVFITSISSTVASVNRGEYCISKAGLTMAAKLFAARLAEPGIPVYEVRPGIIATDMSAGAKQKYDDLIADGLIPQYRWGTPDDVGRAVAAIARGDLPYSTGAVIMVDGGLTLQTL